MTGSYPDDEQPTRAIRRRPFRPAPRQQMPPAQPPADPGGPGRPGHPGRRATPPPLHPADPPRPGDHPSMPPRPAVPPPGAAGPAPRMPRRPVRRPVNGRGAPPPPPRNPRSPFEDSDIGRLPPVYYEEDHPDDHHDADVGVDGLLGDEPPPARPRRARRPAQSRPNRPAKAKLQARRRRRVIGWFLALGLIIALAGGAFYGARDLLGVGFEDYTGAGKSDVIVRVTDGDSTGAIAATLAEADVVASGRAFVEAAEGNTAIRSIRPGYYQVKTQMSGKNAVKAITADNARVGELEIRSGTQLDDLKALNGKRIPGIYSKLSGASCAELNGKRTCVSTKALRATVAKADLADLGAPSWAAEAVAKLPAERKLEGLVLPGLYDIKPGWSAEQMLREVLSSSASQFEVAGLPDSAEATKRSAYEIVVIASVIEREAVQNDFGKVSRVLYNRLAKGMRLEMDSTINYVLDRPHIRTSKADRSRPGPYNSYRNKTLPPTPISAPSPKALEAALAPESGRWLYFVKCEKNGLSCFAEDFKQHQRNVAEAKQRGVW